MDDNDDIFESRLRVGEIIKNMIRELAVTELRDISFLTNYMFHRSLLLLEKKKKLKEIIEKYSTRHQDST